MLICLANSVTRWNAVFKQFNLIWGEHFNLLLTKLPHSLTQCLDCKRLWLPLCQIQIGATCKICSLGKFSCLVGHFVSIFWYGTMKIPQVGRAQFWVRCVFNNNRCGRTKKVDGRQSWGCYRGPLSNWRSQVQYLRHSSYTIHQVVTLQGALYRDLHKVLFCNLLILRTILAACLAKQMERHWPTFLPQSFWQFFTLFYFYCNETFTTFCDIWTIVIYRINQKTNYVVLSNISCEKTCWQSYIEHTMYASYLLNRAFLIHCMNWSLKYIVSQGVKLL